jgi:hypothetical protein
MDFNKITGIFWSKYAGEYHQVDPIYIPTFIKEFREHWELNIATLQELDGERFVIYPWVIYRLEF